MRTTLLFISLLILVMQISLHARANCSDSGGNDGCVRIRDLSSYANHSILQGGTHLSISDGTSLSFSILSNPQTTAKQPLHIAVKDTQALLYLTSGEISDNKGSAFAGGSSCCDCKIDHYGQLPPDIPRGKVSSVIFFLTGSRKDSYYNRIKNGPNTLKLTLGNGESRATSEKNSVGNELFDKAPWILNFKFSPPTPVEPNMDWKLLDGDNNIYSAVLLHSSDIDLGHGIRGYYKTYGCQYSRVEDQSYSVKFIYSESQQPLPKPPALTPSRQLPTPRKIVYKTAVVEFAERGDLGIQDAGAIVAEWITTALNKTGAFEVYERLSLSKLLEEHKLGMTGLLDDETIAEIGRIHGVEAIVHGSVSKFANTISVTAKVIEVETAKLIDPLT